MSLENMSVEGQRVMGSYKRSWLRLQDSGGRSLLSSQEERLGLLGKDGEEEDEEEVAGYGMKGGKRVGIICGRT